MLSRTSILPATGARHPAGTPSPELLNSPSVPLRRSTVRRLRSGIFRPPPRRFALALRYGFLRLPVQNGRHRRAATSFRQRFYAHRDILLSAPDVQRVAAFHILRRLGPCPVQPHVSTIDGGLRPRAGLEEARRPQPLVEPNRRYGRQNGMISSKLSNAGNGRAERFGACESGCATHSTCSIPFFRAASSTPVSSSMNSVRDGS